MIYIVSSSFVIPFKARNLKEVLIKSFDKALLSKVEGLRTNGKWLIPFVVSLSNHEWNQLPTLSLKSAPRVLPLVVEGL